MLIAIAFFCTLLLHHAFSHLIILSTKMQLDVDAEVSTVSMGLIRNTCSSCLRQILGLTTEARLSWADLSKEASQES